MRPIKLTMQAFGPYIDECEINFSEFGDRGLYLVTGNTGAGIAMVKKSVEQAVGSDIIFNNDN